MKYNLKGLVATCLGLYFIGEPLRDVLMGVNTDLLLLFSSKADLMLSLSSLLCFSLYSVLAYTTLFLFYPSKRWLALLAGLVLSFAAPIGLRFFIEEVLYDFFFGFNNYFEGTTVTFYIRDNFYYAFRYSLFGVIFYFITLSINKEKREKDLTITNQKMELSLLQSQINPHFLLNSLNNIYSLVYRKSDQALEALDLLSGMLRYALYEKRVMIQLEEEMTYVQQFVALQSMRYNYPVAVDLQVSNKALLVNIPQFLLIPLIENGFKHGDLKDPNDPLLFEVAPVDDWLRIRVRNRKSNSQKDAHQGIGLDNVKKRLALIYPDQHHFEVQEDSQHFEIVLQLHLQ